MSNKKQGTRNVEGEQVPSVLSGFDEVNPVTSTFLVSCSLFDILNPPDYGSAMQRRTFLTTAVGATVAAGTSRDLFGADREVVPPLIIDTHQHLWDRSKLKLPWLADAPEVLRANYGVEDYRREVAHPNVRTVYMEVDVAAEDLPKEAAAIEALCQQSASQTCGAVIGGRPDDAGFRDYLQPYLKSGRVKGVRRVLHGPTTPQGYCLRDEFVQGVRLLGRLGLSFDLCMRPTEIKDAQRLTELCPETRFILDHCGNGDVNAFHPRPNGPEPSHTADDWKRDMEAIAQRPNVDCKISGIIARAAKDWTDADLAPIVNHCLDSFGPERVVFGGDWPVCLLGAPLSKWIAALTRMIAQRPAMDQIKLWSKNAQRVYRLSDAELSL